MIAHDNRKEQHYVSPSWLQLWGNDLRDIFRPFPKSSNESAEVFQHIRIKLIHLDELQTELPTDSSPIRIKNTDQWH